MKFGNSRTRQRQPARVAQSPSLIQDRNGNMIRGAQPQRQAEEQVLPVAQENSPLGSQIAGVSPISVGGGLDQVQVVLDNSGGASDKLYRIGDPYGLILAVAGITTARADSGLIDPTALENALATLPFQIGMMQLQTSTNSAQLTQAMKYYSNMDFSGNFNVANVPLGLVPRNTQQNLLIQSIEITSAVVLNGRNALTWNVLAGESVTVTFYPKLAGNRG